MKECPCGSGKNFEECCKPVIENSSMAKTAKTLMCARYSAYVIANIDFIMSTTALSNRENMDADAIRKWATNSEWLGLEIVNTEDGKESDSKGSVEFIARYRENGELQSYHEISGFTKENDKWYYSSAEFPKPSQIVRETPKTGRNDPCPCGSGKKYKKCCGKN